MSANGNDKVVISCASCSQRFSTKIPKMDIFNDLRCSVLVATHEKPIKCICGKAAVIGIKVAEVEWTIIPITDAQAATLSESTIFVPPLIVN